MMMMLHPIANAIYELPMGLDDFVNRSHRIAWVSRVVDFDLAFMMLYLHGSEKVIRNVETTAHTIFLRGITRTEELLIFSLSSGEFSVE